jgi:hypothetical protein
MRLIRKTPFGSPRKRNRRGPRDLLGIDLRDLQGKSATEQAIPL